MAVCGPASAIVTGGSFTNHLFAITESQPGDSIINVGPGATSAEVNLTGNIRRADGLAFPPLLPIHANFEVRTPGFSSSMTPRGTSESNRQVNFTQRVILPLGASRVGYEAFLPATLRTLPIAGASNFCVNRIPDARDTVARTNEDTDLTGQSAQATDADGEALIYTIVTAPRFGQLTSFNQNTGAYVYRPNKDYFGADSFSFRVTEANNASAAAVDTGNVSLTVDPVNDPPEFANDLNINLGQGGTTTIDPITGGVDAENDRIDRNSVVIVTPPTSGTAVPDNVNGTGIVFTPNANFQGVDEFSYVIADANGARSLPRRVVISIIDRPAIESYVDDVQPGLGSRGFPSFTNDLLPQFTGTAEPGAQVRLISTSIANSPTVTTDATGHWQITLASPLPSTTQLHSVVAESTAGGVTISSPSVSFTIDTTSPAARTNLASNLRGSKVTESVRIDFAESGSTADPVTGLGVNDLTLTVNGRTTNLLTGSSALLQPDSTNANASYELTQIDALTATSGTYTLALNPGSSGIVDRAQNPLATGFTTSFAVDVDAPKLNSIALVNEVVAGSKLQVPVVRSTSSTGTDISLRLTFSDQQFAGFANGLTVQLVAVRGNSSTPLTAKVTVPIASASADNLKFVTAPVVLTAGLPVGQSEIRVLVTDSSGNELKTANGQGGAVTNGSASFFVFVSSPGDQSISSPGTPVDTTNYFIGARLTSDAANGSNTISVNQPVRVGATIRILNEVTRQAVDNLVVTGISGSGPYQLTLGGQLTKAYPKADTTISWLRPWTFSFDKTTQTSWFTNEDGHYLGQFDPATGLVNLYDVILPNASGLSGSYDPHGVFFDFNTHLTPRVWFVYRNESDGDTPAQPAAADGFSRLGYLDLATKELFQFDLSSLKIPAHEETDPDEAIQGTHAIFIDARGHAWISAEHSNAVIEVDLRTLPNGSRTSQLNSTSGSVVVHPLPHDLGTTGNFSKDFEVHGIQVVVDQRTNEPYVWFTDGNPASTGRIALLRPGSHANLLGGSRAKDQWFEWNIDAALIAEGRLNTTTGVATAHPLFLALDDNETPGIPEDDRIIIPDGGALGRNGSAGAVRILDASQFLQTLVATPASAMVNENNLVKTSPISSTLIPKIPGAQNDTALSVPNQASVDRGGTIYFSDSLGSIGRLNFDDQTLARTTIQAPIKTFTTDFLVLPISMTSSVPAAYSFMAEQRSFSGPAHTDDRSQTDGVDQYEVAEPSHRGRGDGAFRMVLSAENTLHSALAQSDHIAISVFAESNRRQVAALPSPFPLPTGAIVGGRVVLQVLRDGSVILTGRGDGQLLDVQVNLTRSLLNAGRIATFDAANIIGDLAAVTLPGGVIEALGRRPDGNLVRYRFQPGVAGWTTADLTNPANWSVTTLAFPAGQIPAEDPAPAPGIGFTITTIAGHLVVIPSGGVPTDLSTVAGAPRVFAGVGGVIAGSRYRFYGTNQTGAVIEYSTTPQLQDIQFKTLSIANNASVRPGGDSDRELRMMRNIRPLVDGTTIHLFATDGTARLVHYELDFNGNVTRAENISKLVEATDQVFGYPVFQRPFAGRVYTYVSAVKQSDGNLRVYGTNGGELIEFTRNPAGLWRVGNLTNDIRSTDGVKSNTRVPANAVFGAPTVYSNSLGERHILQINADGEMVEYYTLANDPNARFHTQNINLRLGSKSTIPNLRFSAQSVPMSAAVVATTSAATNDPLIRISSSEGNPASPPIATPEMDIDKNGSVTALDALLVINLLNQRVQAEPELGDIDGNGQVTALDALLIINYLNQKVGQASGEGEDDGEAQASNLSWELVESSFDVDGEFYHDLATLRKRRLG